MSEAELHLATGGQVPAAGWTQERWNQFRADLEKAHAVLDAGRPPGGLAAELRAALAAANEKLVRQAELVLAQQRRLVALEEALVALGELLTVFPADHEGHWSQSAYVPPQDLDGWRAVERQARSDS